MPIQQRWARGAADWASFQACGRQSEFWREKRGAQKVRSGLAIANAALWVLGVGLLAAGFALSGSDLAWLAVLVGQAGSPNPRLMEKLHLVPLSSAVSGAEVLFIAAGLWRFRRRNDPPLNRRIAPSTGATPALWLLLGGWAAIAVLSLNFRIIGLARRLVERQGQSPAQLIAAGFGDEYGVVQAVRDATPETAAILIKTQRPLQFLMNYELYPRRFYFYPDRALPASAVPEEWMDQKRIDWILDISDSEPIRFSLAPRERSR
ncbi:MAG: hypothetical protein FJW26_04170 [Acidimicrobiia bacterium]|nr:hypothetical protein [Acidimicrobiia bacterium]